MSYISLQEFQRLSGISDGVLVRLLCERKLCCSIDAEGGLLVDIDDPQLTQVMSVLRAQLDQRLAQWQALITERFAAIIRDELGRILEEAIVLARRRAADEPSS